jgi:arginine exporter protein ArgO
MLSELLAGAVAGLAVAMPVGAIGAYLLGLAARERFAVAAAAALGVASVDGGYALVAAAGGTGLRTLLQSASTALAALAALVLVVLAIHTFVQAVSRSRTTTPTVTRTERAASPGRAFLALVGLTAVNPATILTFSAVVLGRPGGDAGVTWPVVVFTVGAFVASAAWQLLLVGGGSVLGRVLAGRRGQLAIGAASALLMLGLAVAVLVG